MVQVRQSAVDVEVGFPEAWRLPGDFVGLVALGAENRLLERLAEVARQFGQQRQRHGDHGVIGVQGLSLAGLAIAVGDATAVFGGLDVTDFSVEAHRVLELVVERIGNPVHAADGLKHGRGELRDFIEHQCPPELGIEQGLQLQRCPGHAGLIAGTGYAGVARAHRALVLEIGIQVAIDLEKIQQRLAIIDAQILIQGLAADRTRQQLG